KTQAATILASLLLITGFSNVTLTAQLTVKSVGSVRHDANTQVTIVFSAPVEQTSATTFGNYTFSAGITVTGASLMTGLPPANSSRSAPTVLIFSAPGQPSGPTTMK